MSYKKGNSGRPIIPVTYADDGTLDAFGRLRVSQFVSYFSSVLQYHKNLHLWKEKITQVGGTAPTSTLMTTEPSVLLTCPSIGDEIIRQTVYWPYQAGNSQLILMTAQLSNQSGSESECGYCDGLNGARFIKKADGLLYIELLSTVTGAIPRSFEQSRWNVDTFKAGNFINPSNIKLDITKDQIFWIDLEFLAVGRLRAGFFFDGIPYVAMDFKNDNTFPSPYMSTASLPVRYRLKNVSSAQPVTMKAICSTVKSEGGVELFGYKQVAYFNPVTVTYQQRRPVLTISPLSLFQNRPNRGLILPTDFELFVEGNAPAEWELIHNGTLTGATFTGAPQGGVELPSMTRYDTAATAITGGHRHDIGWASADVKGSPTNKESELRTPIYLSNGIDHTTDFDYYSLVCSAANPNTTPTVRGKLSFVEIY